MTRAVVADDAVLFREGLARLLVEAGIDVVGQAGDASEVMKLVAGLEPDLLITDIRMPPTHTIEGLELANAVRRDHAGTAVIVLSQYVEPHYAHRRSDSPLLPTHRRDRPGSGRRSGPGR